MNTAENISEVGGLPPMNIITIHSASKLTKYC